MKHTWLKLYFEIVDDPKMGRLPDWLWRRAIELFLLAGEHGKDGLLPPVEDMAWRLRASAEQLIESLQALAQVGIVHEVAEGWVVTHYKARQEFVGAQSSERVKRYRERRVNAGMSAGYTYSHSEIIRRDGGKCVYCESTEALCVDHIVPIILGGTDDYDNLAAACKLCNSGKAGRTPEQAGYTFLNKEAEQRYRKYVTVTGDGRTSSSSSSSDSLILNSEGEGVGEGVVFAAYQKNIGLITPMIADGLQADIDDYSQEWVLAAIDYATKQEKRSLSYIEGVLKGWKRDGLNSPRKQDAKVNGSQSAANNADIIRKVAQSARV